MADKKTMLPVCVLSLLERYTDKDHRLTQEKITDLVKKEYGLSVDRKAVNRYCKELREKFGYDIVTGRKGTCLNSREFKPNEAKLLIDSVMSNRYIEDGISFDLVYKIAELVSPYFDPHTDNIVVAERSDERRQDIFENIEAIDNAINDGHSIIFDLYKYNKGKKTLYKNVDALPKCIVFVNNRYYLYCIKPEADEHWPCYPVDNIQNIRDGSKNSGVAKLDKAERRQFADMIATDVPSDIEQQYITFMTSQEIIDRVEEAFGGEDKIKTSQLSKRDMEDVARRNPNAHLDIKVTVKANYRAFKKFVKQNPTNVLVENPRNMQEWLSLELMNAVKLNSDADARELSSEDEALLANLSLRGKAIMGMNISYGKYPQAADGALAPIEWLPISIKKDRVQLITKNCIDYVEAFEGGKNNAHLWKGSELRGWLNGEFLDSVFSEEERKSLLKDELSDSVFLPTFDKIRNINYSSNTRLVDVTAYADEKWQTEVNKILAEASPEFDRGRVESFHRQYKTHYCGLVKDEKGNDVIAAFSEERPEREKSLEIKSLGLRPVIWVKAK